VCFVRAEPDGVRRKRDSLFGGFQRSSKFTGQDEPVSQTANPVDVNLQIALPLRVAGIGGGQALADREAVLVGLERVVELALRYQRSLPAR
jgi:hypothetical protein